MKTILVIDDFKDMRENIIEVLNANGYNTLEAENGRLGLTMAKEGNPDLIIADIMMPGMDGIELLEKIKNDEQTSSLPFMFLTAKAGDANIQRGMEAGADCYLTKPFKIKDLILEISDLLG